jgi:hypothetical protein
MATFFSLVAAAAVNASIALRTDWISNTHLLFDADNKALSELIRRISAADRQSLTANPPTKAVAASTAMIIAVIAGVIMWFKWVGGNRLRKGSRRMHACAGRRLQTSAARFHPQK